MNLRIAGVVNESIVDGPGFRYVIFVQGCNRDCPGCHNKHTLDLTGGYVVDTGSLLEQIKNNPILDGVTFSGGEPFLQPEPLTEIAHELIRLNKIKSGIDNQYHLISYTGYTFEQLLEKRGNESKYHSRRRLLESLDWLIDGPFILEKRTLLLPLRGSLNQRVIDVKSSLNAGYTVPVPGYEASDV